MAACDEGERELRTVVGRCWDWVGGEESGVAGWDGGEGRADEVAGVGVVGWGCHLQCLASDSGRVVCLLLFIVRLSVFAVCSVREKP